MEAVTADDVPTTGSRDVSSTFEAYAESIDAESVDNESSGGEPRFTDWLRRHAEPTWTAAVDHRFTRELADGTLDREPFERYLCQDYSFVAELIGVVGYAVGQAPDADARRRLVEFLDVITDDEDDYFRRAFDALDVPQDRWTDPERTQTTAAFTDHLWRAATVGGYAETLAVLVPAEWIYREWATADRASIDRASPWYYSEWIELHGTDGFVGFVDWLREQLDVVGPTLSPRREARVERLFHRTVDLEVAFFDAAYEIERS